ncbi:MAG: recombinase family protein [Propionibacteriales bacterium]|nr:recombinase family protein [Propionibacteriales bacterium]
MNNSAGSLVGYARVSSHEQNLDLQLDALSDLGCIKIFEEKASGTRSDRPELAAALEYLRAGDVLVVWRLDRLGRSLKNLVEIVTGLEAQGIGFRSIHENIDTTSATGRLVFHIFAALAEFERDLIVDRTKAGLAAARERGARPGRKAALSAAQVAVVRQLHAAGEHTVQQISDLVGVSRATVYRALPKAG